MPRRERCQSATVPAAEGGEGEDDYCVWAEL